MVIIRLTRRGKKNYPFYHIIVTDKRNARDGRFIEKLGFYNPMKISKILNLYLNINRILFWINQGATISKRIHILINKIN